MAQHLERHVELIVAVRNEEQSLPQLVAGFDALARPDGLTLGLRFVEDSSSDGTVELLRRWSHERDDLHFHCLAEGFGQGPALVFGLAKSRADGVVMLDADGSHPLSAVEGMLRGFADGAEIVQGVRRELPGRSAWRNSLSDAFVVLQRLVTGVDLRQQNVYFRLAGRATCDRILATPRWWRFLRLPLAEIARSSRVDYVAFDARERELGASKYDLVRLLQLAVEGMVSLLSPVRVAGLAATSAALGVLCIARGSAPLSVLGLAASLGAAFALVLEWMRLGRAGLLERMREVESSESLSHAE